MKRILTILPVSDSVPILLLAAAALMCAWAQGGHLTGVWGESKTRGPAAGDTMPSTQKIVPFLWFNNQAEEAIRFYSSIFPDSKVLSETRTGPKGALISAKFRLAGQELMALNGGPMYSFTEAISLFVSCENQEEVDDLWAKLTAGGGTPGRCGWLKDKYGLSWQVIPKTLGELLHDKDPAKAKRVAEAMLKMDKIDIKRLRQAYDGR
jgi:predicted 3-demethylubiquinone-9 3-methyltransferase (glyoxalase superfamily)